jgi:GNAT superfamily N-acetyltransferase
LSETPLRDGFHPVPPGKVAMVVTYLQMLRPAESRPVVPPEGVALRQVTPDLDWYRDVFRRVGAKDWLWYGRLAMDDDRLSAILSDPDITFHTLTRDGRDEALLELDFRQEGQCELAYFGVTSRLIGTGAGRFLMNAAIRRAWERPIERLHVHTCNLDSQRAYDFYVRSGFTPYMQEVEIDDDPRVTGLLPAGAAPHVPLLRP